MTPLLPPLADTDFEQLVALGRSLLPRLAPSWTDHNTHDPGIMLMELLAWTADAQIYALARTRHDERDSYAALLGLAPLGPSPASGLVWPDPRRSATGIFLGAHEEVTTQAPVPAFRLTHAIEYTAAAMTSVRTLLQDGTSNDRTAVNARGSVSFQPFGARAAKGDQLVLGFRGPLHPTNGDGASAARLAFGVRAASGSSPTASGQSPTSGDAVACSAACPPFEVHLSDGVVDYPLSVVSDGTDGFQRSGAILLDASHVPATINEAFSITFASRGGGFPGAPRIRSIRPNVLPIEQIQAKTRPFATGLVAAPDVTIDLNAPGLLFSPPTPPLCVTFTTPQGTAQAWNLTDDLTASGPDDRVFAFDHVRRVVRFGNGINGQLPPSGRPLAIDYAISAGAGGNTPQGLEWRVRGIDEVFGRNLDPISGGADGLDSSGLQRLARQRSRDAHAVVTAADTIAAALALPGLAVARAEVLAAGGGSSVPADLQVTRTLMALRDRQGAAELAGMVPESPAWLAEIRLQLVPRMLLGERLRVVAPTYAPLAIVATIEAQRGFDPALLARAASALLAARFRIVTDDSGAPVWPSGRSVETRDIQARLRALPGVARVRSCTAFGAGRSAWVQPLPVPVSWLPQLLIEECDITVVTSAAEQSS